MGKVLTMATYDRIIQVASNDGNLVILTKLGQIFELIAGKWTKISVPTDWTASDP
jgi:hypothetical protein